MENMLKGQITGIKDVLKILRENEATFIRANTLAEQIAISQTGIDKLEGEQTTAKEKRDALKARKAELLQGALEPLMKSITSLLPRGEAVITLNDELFIGWKDGARLIPYGGLSGGEKVCFDGALCSAMLKGSGDKIVILEAAEVDGFNLTNLIAAVTKVHPEIQVIVSTWAKPAEVPAGWNVVELK